MINPRIQSPRRRPARDHIHGPLFASAIALFITKRALIAALASALVVAGAIGFGYARINAIGEPFEGTIQATLIAGDQFDGIPMDWRAVWNAYTPQIERAADDGRRIIILPEKIRISRRTNAPSPSNSRRIARPPRCSHRRRRDDEADRAGFNRAFASRAPSGKATTTPLIPGFESHFDLGTGPLIFEHEGVRYGVAIFKDIDFPALGREYAGST